jgi:Plasmid encoded RepA protein
MRITKVQQRLLDAGGAIMAESPDELAFQHTCLAQTCLPHRRPPDGVRRWQRDQGRAHLLVVAGEAWHEREQRFVEIGLPYGPKARLILMHLNSEALRQNSPVVDVESSLTAFVRRIQARPPTGPEIRAYKEQLTRLSAATVRLAIGQGDHALQVDTKIVGAFDLWFAKDARQRVMWPSTVRLSLDYFHSLKRHAVPLDERALAALAHSALALDMYCWLAQRLHRTPAAGQFIPWPALHEQFGQGFGLIRKFRQFFLEQLAQVRVAYPEAKVDADRRGLTLWPSPPPVPERVRAVHLPASDHV